ncbi:MAG TPA: histidine kinase, partial [Oceanicaulis sp.]|nr:histidine kinase [Oceanicaulis sp.]
MTRYLVSHENPTGRKLEDILMELRADVLIRCTKIS